nr:hypothetical protein [uncultured Peptoniphilus sp.]
MADVKSLVIHPATTPHAQLSDEELESQSIDELFTSWADAI